MNMPLIDGKRMDLKKIEDGFAEAIIHVTEFRGDLRILVKKEYVVEICRMVHDDAQLKYLYFSDIMGIDYLTWDHDRKHDKRFEVEISTYSMKYYTHLFIKYGVDLNESAPSVTSVWRGAEWPEREVYDMFGITFENHPDLRRILMADDWIGHPLRKDFPLGGETIPFAQESRGPSVEQVQMPHAGESFEGKTGSENVSGR